MRKLWRAYSMICTERSAAFKPFGKRRTGQGYCLFCICTRITERGILHAPRELQVQSQDALWRRNGQLID